MQHFSLRQESLGWPWTCKFNALSFLSTPIPESSNILENSKGGKQIGYWCFGEKVVIKPKNKVAWAWEDGLAFKSTFCFYIWSWFSFVASTFQHITACNSSSRGSDSCPRLASEYQAYMCFTYTQEANVAGEVAEQLSTGYSSRGPEFIFVSSHIVTHSCL